MFVSPLMNELWMNASFVSFVSFNSSPWYSAVSACKYLQFCIVNCLLHVTCLIMSLCTSGRPPQVTKKGQKLSEKTQTPLWPHMQSYTDYAEPKTYLGRTYVQEQHYNSAEMSARGVILSSSREETWVCRMDKHWSSNFSKWGKPNRINRE